MSRGGFTINRFARGAEHRDDASFAYATIAVPRRLVRRLSRAAKLSKLFDLTPWPPLPVPPPIDIIGRRFGRLLVMARSPGGGRGKGSRWVCVCSCGESKVLPGGDLRRGRIQSCGCIKSEQLRLRNKR